MSDHRDAKGLETLLGFNIFKDFPPGDAFMPMYRGMAHNREATASLGAVNGGRTRRTWRVYTVGFYSIPEKKETLFAGDGRNGRIATLTEMMSREMGTCSLMRELKVG